MCMWQRFLWAGIAGLILCFYYVSSGQAQEETTQTQGPVAEILQLSEEVLKYVPSEADKQLVKEFVEKTGAEPEALAELLKTDAREREKLAQMFEGLPAEVKFRLFLLSFVTRRAIPRGLTDDGLECQVRDGALQKKIAQLFSAPPVHQCLTALEEISPGKLAELLPFLARVYWVGDNPYSPLATTWAANSCAEVTRNVVLVEIVNQSVAARLLVQEGLLQLPSQTTAKFAWSGRPSVEIPLVVKPFGPSDRAALEKLLESPFRVYVKRAQQILATLPSNHP